MLTLNFVNWYFVGMNVVHGITHHFLKVSSMSFVGKLFEKLMSGGSLRL